MALDGLPVRKPMYNGLRKLRASLLFTPVARSFPVVALHFGALPHGLRYVARLCRLWHLFSAFPRAKTQWVRAGMFERLVISHGVKL